jgi:hypothetical protein
VLVTLCKEAQKESPNKPAPIPAAVLDLHIDKLGSQTPLYKWLTVKETQNAWDAAKVRGGTTAHGKRS